jgi:hypothetical protein
MWVYVETAGNNSLIFRKGDFDINLASSAFSFVFSNLNGTSTLNIGTITSGKWYNIFITGVNPTNPDVYIFSHTGTTEDVIIGALSGNYIAGSNSSDIDVSDPNGNIRIASVVFWNSRFSQALCNDWFAIQKGRFGLDSRGNRISQVFVCT